MDGTAVGMVGAEGGLRQPLLDSFRTHTTAALWSWCAASAIFCTMSRGWSEKPTMWVSLGFGERFWEVLSPAFLSRHSCFINTGKREHQRNKIHGHVWEAVLHAGVDWPLPSHTQSPHSLALLFTSCVTWASYLTSLSLRFFPIINEGSHSIYPIGLFWGLNEIPCGQRMCV